MSAGILNLLSLFELFGYLTTIFNGVPANQLYFNYKYGIKKSLGKAQLALFAGKKTSREMVQNAHIKELQGIVGSFDWTNNNDVG